MDNKTLAILFILMAIAVATTIVRALYADRQTKKISREADLKSLEIEQLMHQNDDVNLHNEKLKAVNESVVDALIDRQEYIQVIEKAVETICSLCDNAPNCEGCYWKSVQDDLVLPYRNRTGIVNKDAQNKFTPPAADETDIEDYLPKLSEIELDRVQNVPVFEKTCSNCWKYGTEMSCEGYEPDVAMECRNWETMHTKNCSNCASEKNREILRNAILQGEDEDEISEEKRAELEKSDCYKEARAHNSFAFENAMIDNRCKNWIKKE